MYTRSQLVTDDLIRWCLTTPSDGVYKKFINESMTDIMGEKYIHLRKDGARVCVVADIGTPTNKKVSINTGKVRASNLKHRFGMYAALVLRELVDVDVILTDGYPTIGKDYKAVIYLGEDESIDVACDCDVMCSVLEDGFAIETSECMEVVGLCDTPTVQAGVLYGLGIYSAGYLRIIEYVCQMNRLVQVIEQIGKMGV